MTKFYIVQVKHKTTWKVYMGVFTLETFTNKARASKAMTRAQKAYPKAKFRVARFVFQDVVKGWES